MSDANKIITFPHLRLKEVGPYGVCKEWGSSGCDINNML